MKTVKGGKVTSPLPLGERDRVRGFIMDLEMLPSGNLILP
jgi:hypothetical protein